MTIKRFIILCLISALGSLLYGQITFIQKEVSGFPISSYNLSSADVNGDQWPDIISIRNRDEIWLGKNDGNLGFIWSLVDRLEDSAIWTINVGDLDNNSFNDIIISGEFFGVVAYYQSLSGFSKKYLDEESFFAQASTLFDLNKDGLLDLTVCNEYNKTRFYRNLVNQNFVLDTQMINFRLKDLDSESGNYGCVYSDYDNDNDADLYISRCRPDISNPNDPRRRNLFYKNQNGILTDHAEQLKIDLKDQSWVSDFADLDNDGLMDLVVINHYSPSVIYKQNPDHTFTDLTIVSGFNVNGIPYQLSIQDFDNDGDQDICVIGDRNEIWINEGLMHFKRQELNFIFNPAVSFCIADINQDGMLDIYASYYSDVSEATNIRDRLFLGNKNNNHFIGFNLIGQSSNRNGVGTKITIIQNGRSQIKELKCGESFGIQNSHQLHFGLGLGRNTVDSIIIDWPSGISQIFTETNIDQYYTISEGQCLTSKSMVKKSGPSVLCPGDSLVLYADSLGEKIVWNTGAISDSIIIHHEGLYYYSINNNGCHAISELVNVVLDPIEYPQLNLKGYQISCFDEEINLKIDKYSDVEWNNGKIDSIIRLDTSGIYYGQVKGLCRNFNSDTLEFIRLKPVNAPILNDTILKLPAAVQLVSNINNTNWYDKENDLSPIYIGKVFQTPIINQSRVYWCESYDSTDYPIVIAGLDTPAFNFVAFHQHTINGGLWFSVKENCILETVDVYTDRKGIRRILLQDEFGFTLDSAEYFLNPGKNTLKLDFKLSQAKSKYFITTSSEVNKKEFLTESPWLMRSNRTLHYPLQSGICTFFMSGIGESEYHYFYNWKLKRELKVCYSNRIPVHITLLPSQVEDLENNQEVRFEPGSSILLIAHPELWNSIELLDAKGSIIMNSNNIIQTEYNLNHVLQGYYFVRISNHQTTLIKPISLISE